MTPRSQHSLRIKPAAASPLSRAHKQFNSLIKKLDAARALLAEWKETLFAVSSRIDAEYWPLREASDARLRQLVLLLDEMHSHKLLGKRERTKLSAFLSMTSAQLLEEADDAVFKDIYNRHSGSDFDAEMADSADEIRYLMEKMLGAEFKGEIDVRSPEAMIAALQAQMEAQKRGAAPEPKPEPETPRPRRAAELARERRHAAEAERLKQSLREIFRKLASQLHPDRETDEAQRQRKTALMQRVNVAYAANDMLGLLELQLEVEQIDVAGLANLSEERIKQYNKVLKEQLGELEMEIDGLEEEAALQMDADIFDEVTPAAMKRMLDDDIAALQIKIAIIEEDVRTLGDVKMLKSWLKEMQLPKLRRDDDDLFW
jgi:hypothetical protein